MMSSQRKQIIAWSSFNTRDIIRDKIDVIMEPDARSGYGIYTQKKQIVNSLIS